METIEILRLAAATGVVAFLILAARGLRRAASVVDEVSHLDVSASLDMDEE